MTPSGQTLRLATIVGTEAPAIRRGASVRPVAGPGIVVETGSADGSPAATRGPA